MMTIMTLFVIALIVPLAAFAEGEPSGKIPASTMEVFVFPTAGQDASQQSQDEAACYEFANANTGADPFQLAKQADTNEQLAEAEMAAAEATGTVRGAAAGWRNCRR